MKLMPKIFLPIILITLIISIVIGMTISTQIKDNSLERAQLVTADYIHAQAVSGLNPASFSNEDYRNQTEVFASFLEHIRTEEIIKIKVFNLNHEIIYSTARENVGTKIESLNYENAVNGKISVIVKDPIEDQTNIDLVGYKQVMEIYVPINYDGKIEGVIETYYRMDYVNEVISKVTAKVLMLLGLFSALILITVYLILTFVVIKPINALIVVADKITDGELDTKLPEAKSNDEMSNLVASLEMLVASSKFKINVGSETKNEAQK